MEQNNNQDNNLKIQAIITAKQAVYFLAKVWVLTVLLGFCVSVTVIKIIDVITTQHIAGVYKLLWMLFTTSIYISVIDVLLLSFLFEKYSKNQK